MPQTDRLETWPIDRLKPYDRNARTHSQEQIAKIAASLGEFGMVGGIVVRGGTIAKGHGTTAAVRRIYAAGKLLYPAPGKAAGAQPYPDGTIPVLDVSGWSDAQFRAYVLADNRIAEEAGWDVSLLTGELEDLSDEGFDLEVAGFSEDELAMLTEGLFPNEPHERATGSSELPATTQAAEPAQDSEGEPSEQAQDGPEQKPERTSATTHTDLDAQGLNEAAAENVPEVSRTGDVWLLGEHRVMCGDSTNAIDVSTLMAGRLANLLHADPPYGMGKEADGVANDNLRGKQLDGFQMDWWGAFRAHLQPNASAYIWGNAPDLWRLWYVAGLGDSEVIEFRNEIVWDKKNIAGMASPDLTQYPEATERCLFFQLGKQFLGNVNAGDFHESWEPLRSYMEGEAKAAGMTPTDLKMICSVGMYGHWFTRSQFTLIPESHYRALAAHYPGRFLRPWSDLKEEWSRVRTRSYFDNDHDVMRDVWEFPRAIGEERHGHATPKPVDMMIRAIKSSSRPDELVVEPFGGSGSTLIGAEVCGRVCFAMEMQPRYVDVIVRRWEKMTGKVAILERDGRSFAEAMADRLAANDNQEAGDAVA